MTFQADHQVYYTCVTRLWFHITNTLSYVKYQVMLGITFQNTITYKKIYSFRIHFNAYKLSWKYV